MPKNTIQDVIPPGKRTIRNIPLSNLKVKKRDFENFDNSQEKVSVDSIKKVKVNLSRIFIIVGFLGIVFFLFFIMTVFSSAKVFIVPKQDNLKIDIAVKAYADLAKAEENKTVFYEIMQVKGETEKEIQTTEEEMLEKKASGKIIVYNNFSEESQRLITRTRFQTVEGLIYRISESIIVPGMKNVNGKMEPGTIEVNVYADEPGDKYNIGMTEFTIPGFKDNAKRFAGFYAKSKTKMTGGFIGKAKKISENDKHSAEEEMKNFLKIELEKQIKSKIIDSQIVIGDSIFYDFSNLIEDISSGDKAILKLEGTAKAVVFQKKSLESLIALHYLELWDNLPINVKSYENLSVVFEDNLTLSSGVLNFSLRGQAEIVAFVDKDTVIEKLMGQPKSNLKSVMSDFPAVISAKAEVRPVWKSAFPSSPSKIHIIIKEK